MDSYHDYCVLGAGPAGLQIGYYLSRKRRDFLIVDRADAPGKFFEKLPRHRFLLSINKVYTGCENPELNLRWDWNSLLCDNEDLRFTRYSDEYFPNPDHLCKYLEDYAEYYQLPIKYNTTIERVHREDDLFILTDTDENRFTTRCLILATGLPLEHIPSIPGIELCETYTEHSLDENEYSDQRVLIIGKGNSGFETANHLIGKAAVIHLISPESIRMAWETHFVGSLRAVNNEFLDTYQLKSQNAVIDGNVERIEKQNGKFRVQISYSHASGQTTERFYDRVICCAGFRYDASIFDESCQPEVTHEGRLPAQTTSWESTNIPNMYIAGTLMQACDYKRTQSGFIHGFRHNIRALSWILEEKYHGEPWPHQALPLSTETAVDKVIDRVNSGAGIFQQPGFLCDVMVVDVQGGGIHYYDEVRVDHIPHCHLGQEEHYYIITLEYGMHQDDPFSVERDPSPDMGHTAFYLHPVIRKHNRNKLVATHHINDDLENEWSLPEYVEPVRGFFHTQFNETM